jgi:flagella basal body P-ring formation protein FlgA
LHRALWTIVLIAATLCGAEEAVSKVVLRTEVFIQGPYVRLGDIADVEGEGAKAMAGLVIATPAAFPVFVSADAVRMRLAAEGKRAEVTGARFCLVKNGDSDRSPGPDSLAAEFERAARADWKDAPPQAILRLSALNVWNDTGKVPPASVKKINIEGSGAGADTRWVRFTGEDENGGRIWGWARFDVRIKAAVLAAARGLSRGQVLTAEDVVTKETTLRPGERAGFESPIEVIGRRVLRPIALGEVLKPSDVDRPVVVSRGCEVNVVIDGDGFRLSDKAVAKDDGGLGEVIRVENARSRMVYRARVVSSDTVVPIGKDTNG